MKAVILDYDSQEVIVVNFPSFITDEAEANEWLECFPWYDVNQSHVMFTEKSECEVKEVVLHEDMDDDNPELIAKATI